MNSECDCCGYSPEDNSASIRRAMAECENCSRTLCDQCLPDMAVEAGWCSPSDARFMAIDDGAAAFLRKCETTGMEMCPECFEG